MEETHVLEHYTIDIPELNKPLRFQEQLYSKLKRYLEEHPMSIRELATAMKSRPEALNNFMAQERVHSRTIDRIASWLMEQGIE
ncbi:unnamed protein product [Sphagnum balticum]